MDQLQWPQILRDQGGWAVILHPAWQHVYIGTLWSSLQLKAVHWYWVFAEGPGTFQHLPGATGIAHNPVLRAAVQFARFSAASPLTAAAPD